MTFAQDNRNLDESCFFWVVVSINDCIIRIVDAQEIVKIVNLFGFSPIFQRPHYLTLAAEAKLISWANTRIDLFSLLVVQPIYAINAPFLALQDKLPNWLIHGELLDFAIVSWCKRKSKIEAIFRPKVKVFRQRLWPEEALDSLSLVRCETCYLGAADENESQKCNYWANWANDGSFVSLISIQISLKTCLKAVYAKKLVFEAEWFLQW